MLLRRLLVETVSSAMTLQMLNMCDYSRPLALSLSSRAPAPPLLKIQDLLIRTLYFQLSVPEASVHVPQTSTDYARYLSFQQLPLQLKVFTMNQTQGPLCLARYVNPSSKEQLGRGRLFFIYQM